MYFHAVRINSRIDEDGNIVLLSEQDRSLWDRQMIMEGNHYLNKAALGDVLGRLLPSGPRAHPFCSREETADEKDQ